MVQPLEGVRLGPQNTRLVTNWSLGAAGLAFTSPRTASHVLERFVYSGDELVLPKSCLKPDSKQARAEVCLPSLVQTNSRGFGTTLHSLYVPLSFLTLLSSPLGLYLPPV